MRALVDQVKKNIAAKAHSNRQHIHTAKMTGYNDVDIYSSYKSVSVNMNSVIEIQVLSPLDSGRDRPGDVSKDVNGLSMSGAHHQVLVNLQ